jgi:hypothetical protein
MIRQLLQSDPKARLRSACGVSDGTTLAPGQLSYDALRGHEMFRNAHSTCVDARQAGGEGTEEPTGTSEDELSTVDGVRTVYDRSALKVPTLREICLRATGRAALLLAAAIAENGGSRPTTPAWMTVRPPHCRSYEPISLRLKVYAGLTVHSLAVSSADF